MREALAENAARQDVVITTAQIPGRAAPILITAQAVATWRPGSVIVDLAGDSGGNCELTEGGRTRFPPHRGCPSTRGPRCNRWATAISTTVSTSSSVDTALTSGVTPTLSIE